MDTNIKRQKKYLIRRISPGESYSDILRFPRYLEIETINACNAKCPMCTISDWRRKSRPMTDDLFKKIAEELVVHSNEVKRVTLYRDGEPLLDNKIAKRITMLKNGGIKNVSISTNVSLLTAQKAKEILDAGIDIVIMSIDSLKKDIYENIRKGLQFEDVVDKAVCFIKLRDKIRPETQIWMRMIRQSSNFNEWPQYYAYWKKCLSKNDRVYYHNVFNWGNQLNGFVPISKSYEPNLPCVALWSLLVIFSNGDVPLCNADYNNNYPLGNVKANSISELWQSAIMDKRRSLHLKGRKDNINLCKKCNVWDESEDGENISSQYAEAVEIK